MAQWLPILPVLVCIWTLVPAPAQARTLFVTPTGSGDGASWTSALSSISAALWAADPGDEIWVARGVYAGGHILSPGVSLYGGFAGTETNRSQRRITENPTVLSGGSPILSLYDAGPDTVISGFLLRDSNGSLEIPASGGPGIYIDGGAPVIRDNVITGCRASFTYVCDDSGCYYFPLNLGGGVYANQSSPVLVNNRILGNQSTVPGGGVCVQGGAPEIASNWVEGNRSLLVPGLTLGSGGGIACLQAEASITGNTLAWNVADGGHGGGIFLVGEIAALQDNRFLGNEAAGSGGGAWMESPASDVSLDDNTFTLN
ncbi:MAG: right-handed parallel beta-helix repeat-containing protein, partial [Anaerolineaceae bacterium]